MSPSSTAKPLTSLHATASRTVTVSLVMNKSVLSTSSFALQASTPELSDSLMFESCGQEGSTFSKPSEIYQLSGTYPDNEYIEESPTADRFFHGLDRDALHCDANPPQIPKLSATIQPNESTLSSPLARVTTMQAIITAATETLAKTVPQLVTQHMKLAIMPATNGKAAESGLVTKDPSLIAPSSGRPVQATTIPSLMATTGTATIAMVNDMVAEDSTVAEASDDYG